MEDEKNVEQSVDGQDIRPSQKNNLWFLFRILAEREVTEEMLSKAGFKW